MKIQNRCSKIFYCHDLYNFIISKPKINTFIKFNSLEERENYSKRILQRLNIDTKKYSVLNIHKIALDVPSCYVMKELLLWDGNSLFWPNQVARVKRIDGNLENIYIYLFGIERVKISWLIKRAFDITPLFSLSLLKLQNVACNHDVDNGRYLLYESHGGYPIGIFGLYVRSTLKDQNESGKSQLFIVVAFDFYGKKNWINSKIINPIWQKVHNRVSANILNKIKILFEQKFNTEVLNDEDMQQEHFAKHS